MPAADSLGLLSTAVLNAAAALAVGTSLAGQWLTRSAPAQANALRRWTIAALLLALGAGAVVLWCEAAIMAEVPLSGAFSSLPLVVTDTHYGLAWRIGTGALAAAALLQSTRARWADAATLLLLACFMYTRSMVSHSASEGDFSVPIVADWLHLVCVSAWVGPVLAAGLLVLPRAAAWQAGAGAFVQALSGTATVALGGIVATGLFNAWHNLGGAGQALGSDYAGLLFLKIVLVLAAAALGGVNRMFVMPGLIAAEPGTPVASRALGTFVRFLRIETGLLALVLLVAALLSSTSPPMAS